MDKRISSFRFVDYKVTRLSYIFNPNTPEPDDISFSFEIQVAPNLEEYSACVTLSTKLEKPNPNIILPFELDIAISGIFEFDVVNDSISSEDFTNLCKMNGTVTLFPFLRSAICDITKACNVRPLIIPLINVSNIVTNEEENSIQTE